MILGKVWQPTTIRVKQSHINDGCRGSMKYCPIAYAIKDILHTKYTVLVASDNIYIYELGGETYEWSITPEIKEIIDNYDCGKGMQPFEFKLDIPYKFLMEK